MIPQKVSGVMARFLFCCFALLVFARVAPAEGTYQHTKDDKAMVWNDAPKAGDTASWDGGRDEDGYAAGFGTLTWYHANSAVYARYFGNMVHGKLDGPVNVHSKGKTAHAIFVGGKRSSRWTMGPAPSAPAMAKRLEAVRQRVAKAGKENTGPASAPDGLRPGERLTSNIQLPKGGAKTEEASAESAARQGNAATEPEAPAKGPDMARPVSADTPVAQEIATPTERPAMSKTAKEEIQSSTPKEFGAVHRQAPNPPPQGLVGYKQATEAKQAPEPPASKAPVEKKSEVDDSVRAMMQPPSSLRTSSDAASTSGTGARLTKEDVTGAADTAARAAGYDLNKYERPKADYNAAEGTWSLFYDRKPAGENEIGEPFSVAVDDKTKKASIVTGL